ncbi:TIGR03854 family LLM class F420-dependent oxidoreductase [Dermatobacter hominis]|uniref:TIGR03854 family LLM class F420-dependent oxidoreductase n=1 Tax=Dermatobacter hominis TaxID=2884263 RepID=UPI001D110C98|nr:TIGR03854 family LLM class F420-dependent oxidoreductase [Dermatobacter hominis]UDY34397.1 TIGR03854 family LLM class F420-dependent oxidoreductase [Dermatobacter hominis]
MKVRVGFGLGTRTDFVDERFLDLVSLLEDLRFDSLWLSERITGPCPDPVVALAAAAGRTQRLKFGMSVMVLPGRNPVLVAKELATLDQLSGGRLLPAFGLGAVNPAEQQAFGVARGERAALFDEALPLIRRLWTEDRVDHAGEHFRLEGAKVRPFPRQSPPDVWLGGIAPAELRRVGRLGDGWLPSFVTPTDAAEGRAVVERTAADHGREIDPEHFGVLLPYSLEPIPDEVLALLPSRRPDVDPRQLVASGADELRDRIGEFVDVGFSKFVVVPLGDPADPAEHLARLADVVLPLQT